MNFALSQEQRLLIATVNRFIATELKPLEAAVEANNALPPELAMQLGEKSRHLGLYAMNMPEHLGGGGLTTLDWILAEEQFGTTTDVLVRRAFGNVYDILLEGTSEQHKRWLLPTIAGERTCSVAFTEPQAGSDSRRY